ncbi:MAG: tetratricopeptide repeat protein [Deltaproteobacteria bacterium]|nr:tetratricopeptide repeat protein [Deltaproteobacteria bacterium]
MQPFDDDIREVKKEIVEIRSLVIRTNNLTSALGADLKTVAKKQKTYERRMLWNSAVAYVLFVVLIFVGLKMAYDVRIDKDEERIGKLEEEKSELRKKVEAAKPAVQPNKRDEAAISALYEFYRNENYEQVIAQWDRLRAEKADEELTPNERTIVRDLLAQARSLLSFDHFQIGLQAMHEGRWPDAETELRQAISLDRASPYISRVQFELTEVLKAEGRCEEAISVLQGLIETDLDKDMADDYHLSLADCHERMRQFDRALTLYTQFAEKFENYPNKRWLWQKIRQLREITNQLQGTAAGSTTPGPPVEP